MGLMKEHLLNVADEMGLEPEDAKVAAEAQQRIDETPIRRRTKMMKVAELQLAVNRMRESSLRRDDAFEQMSARIRECGERIRAFGRLDLSRQPARCADA